MSRGGGETNCEICGREKWEDKATRARYATKEQRPRQITKLLGGEQHEQGGDPDVRQHVADSLMSAQQQIDDDGRMKEKKEKSREGGNRTEDGDDRYQRGMSRN